MELMAYARYGMGPFTLDGHAAATLLQSEVSNNYSRSKADMSTWVYNLGGRASVGVLLGETIVYPFVGAEFFHLKGEEYDAGPGIKARPGATSSTVMVPVGLNWEGNYKTRWGVASPVLGFSWLAYSATERLMPVHRPWRNDELHLHFRRSDTYAH